MLTALILCLCGISALGLSQDQGDSQGLSIEFSPEKQKYITWDRLRLYLAMDSGSDELEIDLYLAIATPDGQLFCLVPDLSFSGLMVENSELFPADSSYFRTLVPAARNLRLFVGQVLGKTLVYKAVFARELDLAEGTYTLYSMACLSGTSSVISISGASFYFRPQRCTLSGTIFDEHGLASSATVKIQTTPNATLSDSNGRFRLEGVPCGKTVRVSAWKYGYYCAVVEATPPTVSVILHLNAITEDDDEAYEWLAPDPVNLEQDFCIKCHPGIHEQWSVNSHALSASNQIFQTLYSGTDVSGNPGVGMGYKLDFPNTAGSCALCHAPVAALKSPYDSDMSKLTGLAQRGVFCEFCHKSKDADLSNLMTVYG
ncbi:hypothetical protein J7M28_00750, partial [bacterium]|nr:hypothetical protein [bacterium]